LNTANGEKLWELPTSTTYLKSTFENSIAINKINNTVLFLNTSGELYSINYNNRNIDWVLNFKSSSGPSEDEIFFSFPLVLKNETLTVTTDKSVFVVNPLNGSKIWNQSIPVYKKPIFTEKNLFLISKNKYLMCLDSKNGNIIWSRNISNQINKISKKIGTLEDFIMAENTLIIFSSNGFLISVNYKDGSVKSFKKLIKKGIKSKPIVVDGYLYVLNGSNKLLKIE
jgi:outer membrane protein assembly factor BamB